MLRNVLAEKISLPLFDIVKGTRIRFYLEHYKQSLAWDQDEIKAYQTKQVKRLISYAYENVPFYRDRFGKIDLTPDNFRSLEDLKRIPPLTRDDLQNNLDVLVSERTDRDQLLKSASSGTTGIPITYYKDTRCDSADHAAAYLGMLNSGWRFGDKRLHIWGNPLSIKSWDSLSSKMKRVLFGYKNYPSFLLNKEERFRDLISLINKYKPKFIDGYTSSIYMLARYVMQNHITIHRPERIFTTAENLYDYQREIIETHLAPVTDLYGSGEINGVAFQCRENNYHILEPRVYVESQDSEGGRKRILSTDLENFVMPLIRYDIGDMFDGLHEDRCPCGLDSHYFRKIEGRASELIHLQNGEIISPVTLFGGTAFRKVKSFNRHQTIWDGNRLIFLFEVNQDFGEEDKIELDTIIAATLKEFDVRYELKFTENKLETENKFSYFKFEHDNTRKPL